MCSSSIPSRLTRILSVVEKTLWRKEQKTRHDLGREGLLKLIWDWKDLYHKNITTQLRRTGGSMDWTREAFTMDDNLSAAVRETFIQLHDEGIIYRANRLVNWSTALSTSLSNLEVENRELEGRTLMDVPGYNKKIEFGVLTYFIYEIEGGKTIEVRSFLTRCESHPAAPWPSKTISDWSMTSYRTANHLQLPKLIELSLFRALGCYYSS